MTRLAQHTSGLRSGCGLQNKLQQARREGKLVWPLQEEQSSNGDASIKDQRLMDGARTFSSFQHHVGPSLRKLTTECKEAFRELRICFMSSRKRVGHSSSDLEGGSNFSLLEKTKTELNSALGAFERDHSRALKRLYKHHPGSTKAPSEEQEMAVEDSMKPALDLSRANVRLFAFLPRHC